MLAEFFKFFAWFFYLCVIWEAVTLVFSRFFFNGSIKCLNWLIRYQRLGGTIVATQEAFQRFRRDIWIVLILNCVVVILINLL